MSNNILVTMSLDWADEFDCEQYRIIRGKTEREVQEGIESLCKEGAYFGTNEGWEEGELDEGDFTIETITREEAETLSRLLRSSFGTGVLDSIRFEE